MKRAANIITDQFNRVHDYLRISLIERCNLRCTYCMPEDGISLSEKSTLMTHEEVVAIAKQFVELGVKKIRLTGGEPLIKKNVEKIIRELAELPITLAISTNGILLHKYLELFKEVGLQDLNISLDTLCREQFKTITRRDDFDIVLSNINNAINEGFRVKLNVVLMKGINDQELIDFIEFTKDKNVSVRFIEFMPFDGNKWDSSQVVSHQEVINKVTSKFGSERLLKIKDKENDTSRNYKIDGFLGSFGIISTVSNPFCDSCNRIRLTANGRIKNCLFSTTETDLLTPLRNGLDIKELIHQGIYHKSIARGGMVSNDQFFNEDNYTKNRNMTTIGG